LAVAIMQAVCLILTPVRLRRHTVCIGRAGQRMTPDSAILPHILHASPLYPRAVVLGRPHISAAMPLQHGMLEAIRAGLFCLCRRSAGAGLSGLRNHRRRQAQVYGAERIEFA